MYHKVLTFFKRFSKTSQETILVNNLRNSPSLQLNQVPIIFFWQVSEKNGKLFIDLRTGNLSKFEVEVSIEGGKKMLLKQEMMMLKSLN